MCLFCFYLWLLFLYIFVFSSVFGPPDGHCNTVGDFCRHEICCRCGTGPLGEEMLLDVSDKHCGYGRVRATSRRDQFELHFHSDHTDSRDGFVLKLLESPLGLFHVS